VAHIRPYGREDGVLTEYKSVSRERAGGEALMNEKSKEERNKHDKYYTCRIALEPISLKKGQRVGGEVPLEGEKKRFNEGQYKNLKEQRGNRKKMGVKKKSKKLKDEKNNHHITLVIIQGVGLESNLEPTISRIISWIQKKG